MDGQWPSSIIDISLQLARLPAWERLVRHPLYWPACLPTCQPACFVATYRIDCVRCKFPQLLTSYLYCPTKKVPLTACNTCPLKSAPPIHNFYLNSQSQDKCYSIEKPRMTNRKVLRGKQGDHISLPSDRKVVRQIWQIAPCYL